MPWKFDRLSARGWSRRRGERGLTLLELVIALAILSVLAAAVLPLSEVTVKRTKELELRRALRSIRSAIDEYKADFDLASKGDPQSGRPQYYRAAINETGYPAELDFLVEGTDWGGMFPHKRRYLRRIPRDPFDEFDQGWGLRSYTDDPDSTVWGGENVYDVYSQSEGIGMDGTPYNTW